MQSQVKSRPRTNKKAEVAEIAAPEKKDYSEILAEVDEVLEDIDKAITPKYTLSDAIREGAKLAPQAIGTLKDQEGATCALGAAWAGMKVLGIIDSE